MRIILYAASLSLLCMVCGVLMPATKSKEAHEYTLQYPSYFGNRLFLNRENPLTTEGIFLGRMLFYEPQLSANNKISCASCHQQNHAFADDRAFSVGADKSLTDRNSMSLANLAWIRDFFWDGRARGLETQAAVPLTNPHEMGQSLETSAKKLAQTDGYPALFKAAFGSDSICGDKIVKAIAQFESTLISCNAKYDYYLQGKYEPTETEMRGLTLFFGSTENSIIKRSVNCAHCHGGAKLFIEQYHNNGLDSFPADAGRQNVTGLASDRGKFRVPTLRNIALTAPYMHDGRFKTLQQVLDHYSDHVKESSTLSPVIRDDLQSNSLRLTAPEKSDIIAFLHMLTDSTFINNKTFSNPHFAK